VNFISLTPGTAFDHARSRGGHADERAILYRMLYDLPLAQNERRRRLRVGLLNILQATAGKDNWRAKAKNLPAEDLDVDLSKAFRRAVIEDAELYAALKEGCERFARYRDYSRIPWEDSELRYDLIGKLRSKLASVCLSALEPDLVILDEFQRFKHLLDGDDEASMLATALFEHPDVRVLLLSATPYKMFTLDQENDEDDHYPDFIRTLNFLFNDSGEVDAVKNLLSEHRTTLHACAKGSVCQPGKKAELERALLKVMCRTERVATTRDHNSMLTEIERMAPLTPADLQHAATVDAVAICVKAGEPIEYWKSAPYLINFLKHYELRHKLDAQLNAPSDALRGTLSSANGQLLTKGKFEGYQALDPANPRMRVLFEDTIDKGMWQLLWMPPSMPYIEPGGAYQDKDGLTKALVFSSWSAVPDAIASICSYEAERKMIAGTSVSHSELYDKIKPLLRFAVASNDNRLTGMPVIAWLLPSPTLATKIDPLEIALGRGTGPLDVQELRDEVKAICRSLVETLPDAGEGRGLMSDGIGRLPFFSIPIMDCWTGVRAIRDGDPLRRTMNQAPVSKITSTCWSAWRRATFLSVLSQMIWSMCFAIWLLPVQACVPCEHFAVSVSGSMRAIRTFCRPQPESHPASDLFSICRRRLPCCEAPARTLIGG
jgi:hypothetical protein